jgi:hypothetical protein
MSRYATVGVYLLDAYANHRHSAAHSDANSQSPAAPPPHQVYRGARPKVGFAWPGCPFNNYLFQRQPSEKLSASLFAKPSILLILSEVAKHKGADHEDLT